MAQERLANFEEIWKIGEGSFGSVYKVRHRKTKDIYVLKKVSTIGMSYSDREDARKEFNIHKTVKSDYIVKYESHFSDKNFICILLEYMDGGDVGQYLKKLNGKFLEEAKVWDIFIQTWLGVQYLHARKILHRDLKTINLFLTKTGRLKIGDLGVAKEIKDSTHTQTVVGTPYYLSPELWEERPYNNKSDIWSLGCILYELCTLKHPFDAKTQGGLFLKIINEGYEPIPSFYSKELSEIIDGWLQKNCKDRPTIQQILENSKLKYEAKLLGYTIPDEYDIRNQVDSQKRDFMTTFAKKNAGGKAGAGQGGLMSRDKLKPKQEVKESVPEEAPKRVLRTPIGSSKYKIQSRSAEVDTEAMPFSTNQENQINLNKPEEKQLRPSISNKYKAAAQNIQAKPPVGQKYQEVKAKPISARYERKTTHQVSQNEKLEVNKSKNTKGLAANKGSKVGLKKSESKSELKMLKIPSRVTAVSSLNKDPQSAKPIGQAKKKNLVNNKFDAIKNKYKPALIKKNVSDVGKVSATVQDIDITDLEDSMDKMQYDAPKPVPKSALLAVKSVYNGGIRKLNSMGAEKPVSIPLSNIGDDYAPRSRHIRYKAPIQKANSQITNQKAQTNLIYDDRKTGSKLIQRIKQQRLKRDHRSQDITNSYVDQTSSVTMDSRNSDQNTKTASKTDDTKQDLSNNEEEKTVEMNDSGKSKESSTNYVPPFDYDDETFDIDAFKGDEHFDDDDALVPGAKLHIALDMIKEDDEVDEEFDNEKRALNQAIDDIEVEIKSRWNAINLLTDEKTSWECFDYFKKVFQDDEEDSQDKMEDVHLFIRRKGIEDYKEMAILCYQLLNSYKNLDAKKEELIDLEEKEYASKGNSLY